MGGALTDAVWIFAVVLVLIVLAAAALASRRYLLERSGGTVECALRRPPGRARGGSACCPTSMTRCAGTARSACCSGPSYVFHRRALSVVSRRPADPSETVTLGTDRIVVEVRQARGRDSGPCPASTSNWP